MRNFRIRSFRIGCWIRWARYLSLLFFEARKKGQWFTFTNQFKQICNKMSETHSKYSKGCIWLKWLCMYIFFVLQISWRIKILFEKIKGKNNWNFVDFYRRHKNTHDRLPDTDMQIEYILCTVYTLNSIRWDGFCK